MSTPPQPENPQIGVGRAEIRIEMMSNPIYLSGAREMVAAVCKRLAFPDEACGQIALAVDEALCNVIRHGYDRAPDRPIFISLQPVGGVPHPGSPASPTQSIKIVIEDEARQVDPAVIKSRDLDDVRPGGLGVHIIRAVMDEVIYERRPVKGMRLTMIKRRTSVPPVGPESGAAPPGGAGGGSGPKEEQHG